MSYFWIIAGNFGKFFRAFYGIPLGFLWNSDGNAWEFIKIRILVKPLEFFLEFVLIFLGIYERIPYNVYEIMGEILTVPYTTYKKLLSIPKNSEEFDQEE